MYSETRSNSVGAMSGAFMRNPQDVFGSLLSDTEQHLFRLHRDSTSSREREAAGMHVRSEVNKVILGVTSAISTATPTTTTMSNSSEGSRDGATPSMEMSMSARSRIVSIGSVECSQPGDSNDSISNSQLLLRQDQCCPGFAMPKTGRARNQGNACSIC